MSDLLEDCLRLVYLYLPPLDVLSVSCVCRWWNLVELNHQSLLWNRILRNFDITLHQDIYDLLSVEVDVPSGAGSTVDESSINTNIKFRFLNWLHFEVSSLIKFQSFLDVLKIPDDKSTVPIWSILEACKKLKWLGECRFDVSLKNGDACKNGYKIPASEILECDLFKIISIEDRDYSKRPVLFHHYPKQEGSGLFQLPRFTTKDGETYMVYPWHACSRYELEHRTKTRNSNGRYYDNARSQFLSDGDDFTQYGAILLMYDTSKRESLKLCEEWLQITLQSKDVRAIILLVGCEMEMTVTGMDSTLKVTKEEAQKMIRNIQEIHCQGNENPTKDSHNMQWEKWRKCKTNAVYAFGKNV